MDLGDTPTCDTTSDLPQMLFLLLELMSAKALQLNTTDLSLVSGTNYCSCQLPKGEKRGKRERRENPYS